MGLRDKIIELDCAAFSWVARRHAPWLDATLPRLTHAADNSKLWIATAALLPLADQRRGRRGAIRGIGCVGVTSLIVNQVIKRGVRRPRPSLRHVPAARHLKAQPLTTSFPSGHAASAAAFATGVSLEMHTAAVPLAALAGAVGFSRSYVGVHYPLDVAVGAAIGAGVAYASSLQWPVLPREAGEHPPTAHATRLEARPTGDGVTIVLNTDSGAPLRGPGADELRERLPGARVVELDDPSQIAERLDEAARTSEVLGVAGGDGSIAAAVTAALEHDRPLLILPTGTLNHLARDLRIDSPDESLAALETGEAVAIDIGCVGDQPFINEASFGGYSAMLEVREQLEKRIGRWPAHVVAVARALKDARPVEVAIGGERRRIWMAFIGNCAYAPAGFAPSWRPRLDDGKFDVRLLTADRPYARLRLLGSILTGRLTRCASYERFLASDLEIESSNGDLRLAHDGESLGAHGCVRVRKHDRPLRVYCPRAGD